MPVELAACGGRQPGLFGAGGAINHQRESAGAAGKGDGMGAGGMGGGCMAARGQRQREQRIAARRQPVQHIGPGVGLGGGQKAGLPASAQVRRGVAVAAIRLARKARRCIGSISVGGIEADTGTQGGDEFGHGGIADGPDVLCQISSFSRACGASNTGQNRVVQRLCPCNGAGEGGLGFRRLGHQRLREPLQPAQRLVDIAQAARRGAGLGAFGGAVCQSCPRGGPAADRR